MWLSHYFAIDHSGVHTLGVYCFGMLIKLQNKIELYTFITCLDSHIIVSIITERWQPIYVSIVDKIIHNPNSVKLCCYKYLSPVFITTIVIY